MAQKAKITMHIKENMRQSGTASSLSDSYKTNELLCNAVAYTGFFFWGGVQQIQLRTKGRENGDLETLAP
jgi:hypothetical protein